MAVNEINGPNSRQSLINYYKPIKGEQGSKNKLSSEPLVPRFDDTATGRKNQGDFSLEIQEMQHQVFRVQEEAKKFIEKQSKEAVLKKVRKYGLSLADLPEEFRSDREVVLAAVSQNGHALKFAADSLRADREIVLAAVNHSDGFALEFADNFLKNDREIALAAVRKHGLNLGNIDISLRKDPEVVLAAVTKTPNALNYADSSFKTNRNFILEAVKKNGSVLQFADEILKKDRQIVLAAVGQDGGALAFADDSFKKDREIVLTAVSQYGRALDLVDDSFKKDREIVLAAVNQNCSILEKIDFSFKNDRQIVLAAIRQSYIALHFADDSLKKDKNFVLEVIRQNPLAIKFADASLKRDKEVILELTRNNGFIFKFKEDFLSEIDRDLFKDRDFVLALVRQDSWALQYADPSLKKDREIVLTAVQQDGVVLQFADDSFKKDREVVLAAVRSNGQALCWADKSFQKNREIVLEAVKNNGAALEYVDEFLRRDVEFQRKCFQNSFYSYNFMINPPADLKDQYRQIVAGLKDQGLEFPQRFAALNLVEINQIIASRQNFQPDARPLALIVFPKADWNRAFEYNHIQQLMRQGYQVVYCEAKKDLDLYQAIEEFGQKQKISLLMIGGHGSREDVAFGGPDPARNQKENEVYYLDLSDRDELAPLAAYLENDAVIVLNSCSTGEGGPEEPNVANLLAGVFPGRTVYAPQIPSHIANFQFDSQHRVNQIRYASGDRRTYRATDRQTAENPKS